MSSREKFVATIVSPNGQSIQPLFDSRPSIDPKTSRVCQILPGSRTGVHKVEITNLDSCGVQACPQDGQSTTRWHFDITPQFSCPVLCIPILAWHKQRDKYDGQKFRTSGAVTLKIEKNNVFGVNTNRVGKLKKSSDPKNVNVPWLCVSIRIPVVAGLKLPEDELIMVKCKPQDRMVSEKKESDFNGASLAIQAVSVERRNPLTTFSGGKQEFLCEIGLFRRLAGTSLFSQRVTSGSLVDLGEEVQLRSIVRSGDGWNYSKLTDITVRRLRRDESVTAQTSDVANLVFNDGCRNAAFKMIAPNHPQRDSRNNLLQNFNFRVFLFQDMEDGDSILVSARVIGCVESIDCAPSLCSDDRQQGYGRRKRNVDDNFTPEKIGKIREIEVHRIFHSNGTEQEVTPEALKGWETDMAVKVVMPPNAFGTTKVDSLEQHCLTFVILATALGSSLLVVIVVIVLYCACRRTQKVIEQTPCNHISSQQSQSKITEIYNEIELLDVLSKTIREKKQRVHEEIRTLYGPGEDNAREEFYEKDDTKTLRQIKRRSGVAPTHKKMNNGGYITNVNLNQLSERHADMTAQV
ncbi:hypothetical protein QYM36_009022 [Artemia franciscana]|uniref:ZP domain-containing protein n=1 Tax=Artemia franciscana TaxID=6661 RepID=A0AA88I3H6_ARTSF|nr:hypothetical protein QYM36_009022 [Artemia franciscana]